MKECICTKSFNPYGEIPENFEYVGTDEQCNPVFKCKLCGGYYTA